MAQCICSAGACGRAAIARALCTMHYQRAKAAGQLPPRLSELPMYLEDTAGCWLWQRGISDTGYGTVRVAVGEAAVLAHRWIYEQRIGAIPVGLELDHLCRVRHCVNPDHLEPVTPRENVRRSESPSGVNARKTHCDRGHEFTEANTYRRPDNGNRQCRACNSIRQAQRQQRTAA